MTFAKNTYICTNIGAFLPLMALLAFVQLEYRRNLRDGVAQIC